eukprot:scaffold152763_cov26-Tisochrysis_lutea.AAC.1
MAQRTTSVLASLSSLPLLILPLLLLQHPSSSFCTPCAPFNMLLTLVLRLSTHIFPKHLFVCLGGPCGKGDGKRRIPEGPPPPSRPFPRFLMAVMRHVVPS